MPDSLSSLSLILKVSIDNLTLYNKKALPFGIIDTHTINIFRSVKREQMPDSLSSLSQILKVLKNWNHNLQSSKMEIRTFV